MSSADGESASTDTIASHAVVLDLARVKAASGLGRGVTIDNGSGDVIRVDARARDGVGDDETALRVAAQSDLRVGAAGLGLRDELRHDRAALTALVDVAGDGGFVIDTLDGNAVGAESLFEGRGKGGANGAAEVLEMLSVYCLVLN